jgi:hypothetical protein
LLRTAIMWFCHCRRDGCRAFSSEMGTVALRSCFDFQETGKELRGDCMEDAFSLMKACWFGRYVTAAFRVDVTAAFRVVALHYYHSLAPSADAASYKTYRTRNTVLANANLQFILRPNGS